MPWRSCMSQAVRSVRRSSLDTVSWTFVSDSVCTRPVSSLVSTCTLWHGGKLPRGQHRFWICALPQTAARFKTDWYKQMMVSIIRMRLLGSSIHCTKRTCAIYRQSDGCSNLLKCFMYS